MLHKIILKSECRIATPIKTWAQLRFPLVSTYFDTCKNPNKRNFNDNNGWTIW